MLTSVYIGSLHSFEPSALAKQVGSAWLASGIPTPYRKTVSVNKIQGVGGKARSAQAGCPVHAADAVPTHLGPILEAASACQAVLC